MFNIVIIIIIHVSFHFDEFFQCQLNKKILQTKERKQEKEEEEKS